ncbi:MAG TPA: SRPBCC family protein [Thermoplasmata archaeon]|nr:SRPBCC family protein [Thermoplasmata archaeon]
MITFETEVSIRRSSEAVFRFVADGQNAPLWNSAVRAVSKITDGDVAVGTRYHMVRELPMGRVENTYQVVEHDPHETYSIMTLTGPTPFRYRYRFEATEQGTRVRLAGDAQLGGVAGLLGPLAAATVRKGVDANLQTLKRLLESGETIR